MEPARLGHRMLLSLTSMGHYDDIDTISRLTGVFPLSLSLTKHTGSPLATNGETRHSFTGERIIAVRLLLEASPV